jgi:hypothetical protein
VDRAFPARLPLDLVRHTSGSLRGFGDQSVRRIASAARTLAHGVIGGVVGGVVGGGGIGQQAFAYVDNVNVENAIRLTGH